MKIVTISINKQYKAWHSTKVRETSKTALAALSQLEPTLAELKKVKLSILLADDPELRELKNTYLGIDTTTNVLSFPAFSSIDELISSKTGYLGDIAISFSQVYNESIEQGKGFEEHLIHLIIHSILHLLGYDHIDDDEAEEMEELEIKALALLKIKNPYGNHNL